MTVSLVRARLAAVSAAVTALVVGAVVIGLSPFTAHAAPIIDLQSPDALSGEFGGKVLVLANGNYVVVDSLFDQAATLDVGAVYLYNGVTNAPISKVTGSATGDQIGSEGVTEVGTSDFVILSASWHTGGSAVGATTFVDGTAGLAGQVSLANSLVGSTSGDFSGGSVIALTNGNYVVSNPFWNNGLIVDAGAATWASGTTGLSGTIGAANSLVGTAAADSIGSGGVTALTNGNYVVSSPLWDNGPTANVGAVTWASGTAATHVVASAADSIVGVATDDMVGFSGATALTNGNYVVSSPFWDAGATADVGAVTWASGSGITSGTVSASNSLVGSTSLDLDRSDITALTNGNYVVSSPFWDAGATADVGAVTWANGSAVAHAVVSAANSLVGTIAADNVGSGDTVGIVGVTALSNGNFVVLSPFWSNGATIEVGAATWASGTIGLIGQVSSANSLVGSTDFDHVGIDGVTALSNGSYVVSSPFWDSPTADVGAVTWATGVAPTSGPVTTGNSLVGTTPTDGSLVFGDNVGSGGITALTDGNYVVSSPGWNAVGVAGAGAVTWASGIATTPSTVSAGNSLVGTRTLDHVGVGGVMALAGGNYVVTSPQWDSGPLEVNFDAGAATFGPTGGVIGEIVPSVNSAVGTPPAGFVGAASPRLTSTNTVLVATSQNRVLRFQQTDFQPPVILQDNITVDVTAPQAVTFTPTVFDNVGVLPAVCTPASGADFPLGVTPVACTATDTALPSANTASKSFTVTRRAADVQPPTLVVPSHIIIGTAPGATTQVVTFVPTASDNVGLQTVGCGPTSGSTFSIGDTAVTCSATDTAGLTVSGTFTVTVNDLEPPVLVGVPGNISVDAAPGASSQAVTFVAPTATDNRGVQGVGCDRPSGTLFPVGVTTVTCTATDISGLTASKGFTVTVTAAVVAASSEYIALQGGRLSDTRPGESTTDGEFAGIGIRSAGSTLQLAVVGRGDVGADATAVALNVTAVGAAGDGFVTVFPCGSDRPTASSLNFTTGSVTPNAVIVKVGTGGTVCLFVSAATQLVVDVNGYFPPTTSLVSLNPARVLETRPGLPTIDGLQQGIGALVGGSVTTVQIGGRVTVPSDASAVVLNATITEAQGSGFATVFPCGSPIPTASNINFVAGSTVANLVVSKLGQGGTVCVFTNQGTHLVVDVAGYFPQATSYHSLVPARLLETRPGESTIDGLFLGAGLRQAGEVTELTVTNRGLVPPAASSVVLNVTVTEPTAAGFVTVYPCGIPTPLASNLNFESGSTVANAVIVKVGSDGKVCFFNSKPTHLVVDVNGYMSA